jgi:hypothetical protein
MEEGKVVQAGIQPEGRVWERRERGRERGRKIYSASKRRRERERYSTLERER